MRRCGFTLTELLVVVVMLGVISAIIQPKFQKVIDTYKALEAEHVMLSVRTEQTARCTLDRDYTNVLEELVSVPAHDSHNFSYRLTSTGIIAANLAKDYELVMKSYQHGGFCCRGKNGKGAGDCGDLIKNYPLCSEYNVVDQTGCDAPED